MALTKVKLIADGVITSANLDASHGITTSDIGEGSNLYYTDARVSSYLSTNGFATQTDIVAAITDSAPVTLDTLNELAAALGDDPNFATTTATSLGLKAPLASPSFTGNATFAGNVTVNGFFTSQGIDDNADTTAITINGNEEVGIGTTSPFYKLDVNGTFRASSNATFSGNVGIGTTSIPSDHRLQIHNADAAYARFALTNSASGSASGDGLKFQFENLNGIIKNQENGYLTFGTNGRETDLRIDSSGDLYVGGTTNYGKVTIEQGGDVSGLVINNTTAHRPRLYLRDAGGAGYSEILANNDLYLNASAVGIGTDSPSGSGWDESSTVLHLYKNSTSGGLLALESSNTKGIINAGNNQLAIFTTTNDPMRFGTNGSESMRIAATGHLEFSQTSTFGNNASITHYTNGYMYIRGGSSGLVVGDNSSSTRALFSNSDFITWEVNNTAAMHINSSQKVGIGTTSPSPKLHLKYAGGSYSNDGDSGFINEATTGRGTMRIRSTTDNPAELFFDVNGAIRWDISCRSGSSPNLQFYPQAATPVLNSVSAHTFELQQNGNVIVTGNGSSGRMGIGETSPQAPLHIYKNAGANTTVELLRLDCGENSHASGKGGKIVFRDINVYNDTATIEAVRLSASSASVLNFRLRNSSNGPILALRSDHVAQFQGTSTSDIIKINSGTGLNANVGMIIFQDNSSTYLGQITANSATTTTSYLSASDYRLKEDLKDFDGLGLVSNIKVYDFKWKAADERAYGVMAHELKEVIPQAVDGEKDAERMQSADYSKIVPILVKAIQELKADNDSLRERIQTLENQ